MRRDSAAGLLQSRARTKLHSRRGLLANGGSAGAQPQETRMSDGAPAGDAGQRLAVALQPR